MKVVAGSLRGRALKAPPGDATRPTGARVKEALFSILGDVSELGVLDLYAGSGALGIEALSRGASSAVFVESARPALACLRDNLAKLGLEARARVLALSAESAGGQLAGLGPFQLVLCDPPWKMARAALELLERQASAGFFAVDARIALEHAARDDLEPGPASPLFAQEQRRWGDTSVTLLGVRA